MSDISIKLEIADLLGFCDLNGVDALDSDQVERLENYIYACNNAMNDQDGAPLVADSIYDKMVELLKAVNPDAQVLKEVWSADEVDEETFETEDIYKHLRQEPMRSIQTCKSFDCDEVQQFYKRLPDGSFNVHASVKLNGHGIRLVFKNGDLVDATSRARNSAGHNLYKQIYTILYNSDMEHIYELESYDTCEIRGELLLSFANIDKAREYNKDIVSPFTGVSSMLRDSASEEEWGLLEFVAYKFIADDKTFPTKSDEYSYLEDMGFETPACWLIENTTKENLITGMPTYINDFENAIKPANPGEINYRYYTDGIVIEVDDRNLFKAMGDNGSKYSYGNVAMKVGYWKQDCYVGFVQAIMWTRGKNKLSPVAIVAEQPDMAEFTSEFRLDYIRDMSEIEPSNWKQLGVVTACGNKVRRVPLYEPNNILMLNAYVGEPLHFRYGGEAGVVPCFPDGTPLTEGKIKNMFSGEEEYDEYGASDDEFGVD